MGLPKWVRVQTDERGGQRLTTKGTRGVQFPSVVQLNNKNMNNKEFASDSCLSWHINNLQDAITRVDRYRTPLKKDDCKKMLDMFFVQYRDRITNDINKYMEQWIKENGI